MMSAAGLIVAAAMIALLGLIWLRVLAHLSEKE